MKNKVSSSKHFLTPIQGIKILKNSHPDIRKLKRDFIIPQEFGYKIWDSTYPLINYLKSNIKKRNFKSIEIGCGFGIISIFLKKYFNARPLCIDFDSNVKPYLELYEKYNDIKLKKEIISFKNLKLTTLNQYDLLTGNDICYSEDLLESLTVLLKRIKRSKLREIIIGDPVRWPFEDLLKIVAGMNFKKTIIYNNEYIRVLHIYNKI